MTGSETVGVDLKGGASTNQNISTPKKKLRIGVIGTFVWDVIYGRDKRSVPVEEWGGITYTLAGLDAALPDDWEIVPILKVGEDLADRARLFCKSLKRMAPDAELIAVPYPNQRVELRYTDAERRTEILTGGVPAWTWQALKPVLDAARLDALFVNFLSGWELDLPTVQMIRRHLDIPIHCDLHMLMWAVQADGRRTLRPLPDVAEWCACFDVLQMNEEEMAMLAPDPMALAATAMAAGTSCLCVTLGRQGVVYVAAPGFERLADRASRSGISTSSRGGSGNFGAVRTALVPAEIANVIGDGDPTGCGDVWGATYFSKLLAGDKLSEAIVAANRAAARNVEHRGATGLAQHLRGELSTT